MSHGKWLIFITVGFVVILGFVIWTALSRGISDFLALLGMFVDFLLAIAGIGVARSWAKQHAVAVNTAGNVSGSAIAAGGDVYVHNNYYGNLPEERRRHVPISPPDVMIGRKEVFEDAMKHVAGAEAFVIHGLGGMGKTALAASLAAAALAKKDEKDYRYPDGVLWLTVENKKLAQLCDAVFTREGEIDLKKQPVNDKPGLARDLLANRKLVVVLDDVDEGNSAALDWRKHVQPQGLPLIVTSREGLPGFTLTERLEELTREDAIRLLRLHAGETTSARLGDDTANTMADTLGDHPLALELLGEHLKRYYPNDPESALDKLGAAHEAIQGIDRPGGKSKDDSVFVSLGLSWDRLDDKEQLLLARLAACFAPATGDELLQRASGLTDKTYRTITGDLSALGLIRRVAENNPTQSSLRSDIPPLAKGGQQQGARWGVHALVRAFVRATLKEDGWKEQQRAMVEACVGYAQAHNGEDVASHDLLDMELRNLLDAAAWAAKEEMHQASSQLALDLTGSSEFTHIRGYSNDSLELLESGLKSAQLLGNKSHEGAHLGNIAQSYFDLGLFEQALEQYNQALAFHTNMNNLKDACLDLIGLGNALMNLKQVGEAEKRYRLARETAHNHNYLDIEGMAAGDLGNYYLESGKVNDAVECYYVHLEIARQLEDLKGEVSTLANLGYAHIKLKQFDKAAQYSQQALDLARKYKYRSAEGTVLANIGLLHEDLGQHDKALRSIEKARAIFVEIKAPQVAECDEALARLRGRE